jgi:23S rRNA pseudouridine2605 synthase
MIDHVFDPNAPDGSGQDAAAAGPDDLGGDGERVAKALARAGVASRREVERLIEAGRVRLNGKVLDTPAIKITPGDVLSVDGVAIGAPEPARVWRYHKPVGLVTTHKDPKGRPTVFDHLPAGLPRVISVGRLDLNTEGLLLLTNDGALARALELPATGLARRYRARARGSTSQETLDRLKDGLTVEGVRYGPIEAKLEKANEAATGSNLWITLTLHEGKNREVRKVLEAIGLTVNRLIRLTYGPFQLGALESGGVEEVGPRVIREQLGQYIAPENLPTGSGVAFSPMASPSGAGRRGGALSAESKKPTYKPGWAKPKKRVGHARGKTSSPKGPRATARDAEAAKPYRASDVPGRAPKAPIGSGRQDSREKTADGRAKRPEGSAAPAARPARGSGAHRRGPPSGGGQKPRA